MNFSIIVFPGSNCDEDMVYALREILGQNIKKIFHKETSLPKNTDCVIIPGGFSYGDYLRSGAIARFSPIMSAVQQHAQRGGFVWGICNGFQILTEAGLLEGALLKNNHQKYSCKNVFLKITNKQNQLTQFLLHKETYQIPIAHGDGRFYADEDTLKSLQDNEQILFHYADKDGNINENTNPNGSLLNIAGICNKSKNVFGMMPHPERACDEKSGNIDGKKIFISFLGL
ncbi:MAG: phosphoribosylformylglycinamidine synthase subunit PurQ [Bacteroidetes bacterium]|nr:MAG: phosphoribosylformylglycinamidine synthase subunit PurQ [Bacteroidota bacterium]TAG90704.1 MAG: phosphoribosylformylglycinamidine synthase subunit PurQ [Bacteroidota bacterium]